MIKSFSKINTVLGDITITASEDVITGIYHEDQDHFPDIHELGEYVGVRAFEDVAEQLQEYFKGQRYGFKIFTLQRGTSFQKLVWRTLHEIPYGETVSYKTLMQMLGVDTTVRAVASAVAKNPLAIITPCHRVIPSEGEEKYASYTPNKQFLLEIEERYRR